MCSKEEVVKEVDETISDLPRIGQDGLLTINGYPSGEVYIMFKRGVYFSIFYCLCFVK